MVFSSLLFLFRFLPVLLIVYFVAPRRYRNGVLFLGSLIFYGWGEPVYISLLLFSTLVDYIHGRLVWRFMEEGKQQRARLCVASSVIINLGLLGVFKYADFLMETVGRLLGIPLPLPGLALPIGISFYTFQTMSYTIDIYRKEAAPQKNIIDFGAYVSMFPQLIAGPIVRYHTIAEELRERTENFAGFSRGVFLFTVGLGKKVLIANTTGALWTQISGVPDAERTVLMMWLGILAFGMQIYFDFYGYSLMAKGLGEILGFRLPNNFEHPYMALSMAEFWRKWHITLGNWFRDYLYIPLGGNRKKPARTFFNLFSVWLLTGFWHGASWNFLLWGLLLFVLISVEKLALLRFLHRFPLAGHAYMALAIPLTWMVFALPELSDISVYVQRLFPFLARNTQLTYFNGDFLKYGRLYSGSLTAGLVFITALPRNIYNHYKKDVITAVILLLLFWACIYRIRAGADDPFLYFRF